MADTRRNQRDLSQQDWNRLVVAINALHGVKTKAPAYRAFVNLHVEAMSMTHMAAWGVHYMGMGPMSNGRNFLTWHRRFLRQIELRLQREQPGVVLPYWDWVTDRALPTPISTPPLLTSWSVKRSWNPTPLPSQTDIVAVLAIADFSTFQITLEHLHDRVHVAVGGNMDTAASPSDPLFFLHHANIDRLWHQWQQAHPGQTPPNPNETLQPRPIEGVKVSTQLSIAPLGYSYA
jgi:tyrosinase